MRKPSNEDAVSEKELLQQMPRWARVLMKFLVVPLLKAGCFLEGLVRTRWEVVPLDDLPAARERWKSTGIDPDQVRDMIERRPSFLCLECHRELKPERQDAEELFPDVWEVRKFARCEACAADREHLSRIHHGYLLFREDDRWMAIVPRVPFLRRCWLCLGGEIRPGSNGLTRLNNAPDASLGSSRCLPLIHAMMNEAHMRAHAPLKEVRAAGLRACGSVAFQAGAHSRRCPARSSHRAPPTKKPGVVSNLRLSLVMPNDARS